MKIKLRKQTDNSFYPVCQIDIERAKKIPTGKLVDLEIIKHRSNPQLRLFWKIAQSVLDNTTMFGGDMKTDNLVDITKIEFGYCRTYKLNGIVKQVPKSISFAKMPADEFNKFFEFSINLWSRFLQIEPSELISNCEGNI